MLVGTVALEISVNVESVMGYYGKADLGLYVALT